MKRELFFSIEENYFLIKRNTPIPASIAITRRITPEITPIRISLRRKRKFSFSKEDYLINYLFYMIVL